MTQNTITDIKVLKEPGAIFAAKVETDYIELNNYKYIDFIVSSGAGTAADVTVTIKGKSGTSGTAKAIAFRVKDDNGKSFTSVAATGDTLSIGGTAGSAGFVVYRVTADSIAKEGFDRVNINTTAVANSTVVGTVIAVLYEPRYT